MNVYEIPHVNLGIHVQYRVLTPADVTRIARTFAQPPEEYKRQVLEAVIENLKPDITTVLRRLPTNEAKLILESLFNGSVMLNPGLDIERWARLTREPSMQTTAGVAGGKKGSKRQKAKKISRTQFLHLEQHLKERVIGQNEAIDEIVQSLKRSQVGLNDECHPIGVFLFAGASGIGKTLLARELHKYLFGDSYDIVRVDCGEYQHKHENAKLLGAPPGYLGYDEGGHLTNQMLKHPQTVVLLDEAEKAHPDLWNTFLRIFDEGMVTSADGKEVSFRDAVIVMTTNLGNREIVRDLTAPDVGFSSALVKKKTPIRARVERLAQEEIRKGFRPEFLNRIEKIVVFNHLTDADFLKIAEIELQAVDAKLAKRGFSMQWNEDVLATMVNLGNCAVQGARKLAQIRREGIENQLADELLTGRIVRGTMFQLSARDDDGITVTVNRPRREKKIITNRSET